MKLEEFIEILNKFKDMDVTIDYDMEKYHRVRIINNYDIMSDIEIEAKSHYDGFIEPSNCIIAIYGKYPYPFVSDYPLYEFSFHASSPFDDIGYYFDLKSETIYPEMEKYLSKMVHDIYFKLKQFGDEYSDNFKVVGENAHFVDKFNEILNGIKILS